MSNRIKCGIIGRGTKTGNNTFATGEIRDAWRKLSRACILTVHLDHIAGNNDNASRKATDVWVSSAALITIQSDAPTA